MNGSGHAGPALRAEGLRKSYRGRLVLDVPEFELEAGATTAVLGSSGAGKSTLLRILGLLEAPDEGRVLLDDVERDVRDRASRKEMAAVFQQPHLFGGTVAANVEYGLRVRRVAPAERRERVDRALGRVGLEGLGDASALTLSGGEAQRVALARALVLEPRVLLLDEPLGSLDPVLKDRLTEEFARILADAGTTTLYVTHDQDEAMVVADHVGIMHEGRFVTAGRADQVMGLPANGWVAGFVGMEPALEGRIARSSEGMAEIDCGDARVFAVTPLPAGTHVALAVRPEDVTLFAVDAEIPRSSARNRIGGRVAEVRPRGATVRVVVEHGSVRLAASVSRAAVADLGLALGTGVTAQFKATAVRVAAMGTMGTPTRRRQEDR